LQEIYSIKQRERSVSKYFTDLKALWKELESLRPTPRCVCEVKCSCDLKRNVIKHKDLEYAICFFEGSQ